MPNSSTIAASARSLVLCALALFPAVEAWAGGLIIVRSRTAPEFYQAGTAVDITVEVELLASEKVCNFGLEETIPAGWTYGGRVSGLQPIVEPGIGTAGNAGQLSFAWFTLGDCDLPDGPIEFTYRLNVPASSIGTQEVSGRIEAQFDGQLFVAELDDARIERLGSGQRHSADSSDNFIISLSEFLRVLQFYTIGSYSCAFNPEFSEDGYVAGPTGDELCTLHASDFDLTNDGAFRISLSELLRLVQLYNARTYHQCPLDPESEDGFCPGPPPLD